MPTLPAFSLNAYKHLHLMNNYASSVHLYDVVYIIIPRLHRAQKLVNNTLDALIDTAKNPNDLHTRLEQRRAFTLELQATLTNLEHLLERYRADVQTLLKSNGSSGNRAITTDDMEQDAIERAKDIYQKVVAFQTGRRSVPW